MENLQNTVVEPVVIEKPVVEIPKVDETKKASPAEVLRKMSKEFSIDLFSEDGFDNLLETLHKKDKDFQAVKAKADELEKGSLLFKEKEQDYQVKIEALGLGFSSDNLDEVLALAKVNIKENQTISDGLKAVKEKYATTFITQKNVGLQHNGAGDKPDIAKNEQERYLSNSKAVQRWNKDHPKK